MGKFLILGVKRGVAKFLHKLDMLWYHGSLSVELDSSISKNTERLKILQVNMGIRIKIYINPLTIPPPIFPFYLFK